MRQSFEIPWEPTAKGRPRFVRTTGHTYTPGETRHAEAAIRTLLMSAGAQLYKRDAALCVHVTFFVPRPASAPKRVTRPTKRPDLDQYIKLLLDAAQGVLWLDDAQIVEILARKAFATKAPYQYLDVWAWEDAPVTDWRAA